MAKVLRTEPPSSSIARLLDPMAAARATNRAALHSTDSPRIESPQYPAPRVVTAAIIKREFILTPDTNATLDRMVDLCRRGTRTRLAASQVVRAVLLVMRDTLDELTAELSELPPTRLPSNAPACKDERDRFEHMLSESLKATLRRSLLAVPRHRG